MQTDCHDNINFTCKTNLVLHVNIIYVYYKWTRFILRHLANKIFIPRQVCKHKLEEESKVKLKRYDTLNYNHDHKVYLKMYDGIL